MIFIGGLSSSLQATPSLADPIRICLDSESYPPYFYGATPDREEIGRRGMIFDLIRLSADSAKQPVQFIRKPWRRCLADVKSGQADASAPVIWSEARALWAKFPTNKLNQVMPESALWSVEYRVFTRNDSTLRWDGQRFTGIRYGVGAPLGHISHKKLKTMGILPSSSFTVSEGLKMVSRGFLDGFVNESLSGQALLDQLGLDKGVYAQSSSFLSSELYLVFSRQFVHKNAGVAEDFYQALATNSAQWKEQLLRQYVPDN